MNPEGGSAPRLTRRPTCEYDRSDWCAAQKTPGSRMEPASGEGALSGLAVETDDRTGLAARIAPVRIGPNLDEARPAFWE